MSEMRRVPVSRKKSKTPPSESQPTPTPDPEMDEQAPDCACPHLDAADWHETESDWSDITFIKQMSKAVLGVPLGFNKVRASLEAKAARAGATVPPDAMLLMGAGRFLRPMMLEAEGGDGSRLTRPGGVAYSRLLPAPWGELTRLLKETVDKATERYGRRPDDTWVWYLTCARCSSERDYETLFVAHYRKVP
jgi:hypothetical protein